LATLVVDLRDQGELPYIALEHLAGGTGALEPGIELPIRNGGDTGVSAVRPGDVLFGKLRPYLAKTLLIREPAYASTELLALRPSQSVEPRYFAHVVGSRPLIEWASASSDGTKMPRTSWEELGEFRLRALPNVDIQRTIADYLDRESARIDALITKKQQMIELFKERRTTLISSAISGDADLDSSVGGVKLSVAPLKHLAALPITNGVGEAAEFDDPSWPRYVRTTDIAGPRDLRQDTFKSLPPDVARRAPLRQGDIVMTAAGATIGKSLLYGATGEACYAGYLVRFRPTKDADGRFVAYWMESMHYWDQIATGKVVSTIENFSAGKYQNLSCPNPPLAVQRAIADFLDRETARIDTITVTLERQIVLLRERRQALITAAVTGELEVSGVTA
jgi:predicted transcriptional regulator